MKYKVFIRKNETGEVRVHPLGDDIPWNDGSQYWWTNGNFGCDCNREWEFIRAAGEPIPELPPSECGHSRYSVSHAELEDGSEIVIDGYFDD